LIFDKPTPLNSDINLTIVESIRCYFILPSLDALNRFFLARKLQIYYATSVRDEDGQGLLLGLIGHEQIGGAAIEPSTFAIVPSCVILALPEFDFTHLLDVTHSSVNGERSFEVLGSVAMEEPGKVIIFDGWGQRIIEGHGVMKELIVETVEKPFGCRVSHKKMSSIRIQSLVEHDLQQGRTISHLTGSSLKK